MMKSSKFAISKQRRYKQYLRTQRLSLRQVRTQQEQRISGFDASLHHDAQPE